MSPDRRRIVSGLLCHEPGIKKHSRRWFLRLIRTRVHWTPFRREGRGTFPLIDRIYVILEFLRDVTIVDIAIENCNFIMIL